MTDSLPTTGRAAAEEEYARLHPANMQGNKLAVRRHPAYDDSYLRDTSLVDAVLNDDWLDRIPTEGQE
jgi:hypothetical protein